MKPIYGWMLILMLLGLTWAVRGQEQPNKQQEAPRTSQNNQDEQTLSAAQIEQMKQAALAEWKELSVVEKQRRLVQMSKMQDLFRQPTDFELFGNYPFNGIGVAVHLQQERTDKGGDALGAAKKYVAVVGTVWEGSPAARAGIQIGERLVSINGVAVCEVESAKDASGNTEVQDKLLACSEETYRKLHALSGRIVVVVLRQAKPQEVALDTSDVARQQSAEFEKVFHEILDKNMAKLAPLKQALENLLRDIKEAGDAAEKLDACFNSALSLSVQYMQLMSDLASWQLEVDTLLETMQHVRE